ncbi:MAG: roadblock/LC7 domain-containing protein, partial [Limisphaerales bacterium]
MKSRFAGMLRGLLRRFGDEATETPRAATAPQMDAPRQSSSAAFAPPPVSENSDEIQLHLQSVLAALPLELRAKIMNPDTAEMLISISIEKILPQLATGSVKITFGELRRLAPGVFANSGGEQDARPVTLPLNQILRQINPALLARRAAQKQVEIVGEISSPFDARGEGLKISTEPVKAPSAAPPLSRLAAPVQETPIRPQPVAPPPLPLTQSPMSPVSNGNGHHAPPQNIFQNPRPNDAPESAAPTAPKNPIAFEQPFEQTIFAPLAALSEHWPETLQTEIMQLNLADAQVALPANLVKPALKRGRVIFSWRHLRSWIKPATPAVSAHDNIELELPLKVLAPLFVSCQKTILRQRQKLSIAEEIPNLFFGFPQPRSEPPPPAARPATEPVRPVLKSADAKLADTNFYIWGENGEAPKIDPSEYKRPLASVTPVKPKTPQTDFLSRYATPKQIVERAMALPGVAGAVVSLQDGLKVASEIPPELNADTLAEFLPQIFERVTQCSKELRMGELNNLNFTVGNVPWKIFRVNAVYF